MMLASLIAEAKQVYLDAGLDCADGLLPPSNEVALEWMASSLSLPMPPDLLELFRIHGGQQLIPPGISGLFGEHRLHTPAEVVEHYQMFAENCLLDPLPPFPPPLNAWGYWVPQLIPFASWDAYDLCIYCDSGEVWEFIPNCGLVRRLPSIAAVLRQVVSSVRSGNPPELGPMRGPP